MPAPEINVINLTEGGSHIEDNERRIEALENSQAGVVHSADYDTLADAFAAATEGDTVVISGTHTLNATITVAVDSLKIVQTSGAVLKAGASPTGTMASLMRVFELSGRAGVVIEGLTFDGPDVAYSGLDLNESAAVHLTDCVGCSVRGNTFTMSGHSSDSNYARAVMVKGSGSADNDISNNDITGAELYYSYAGASRTRCCFNTVKDSPANGISGNGNTGTPVDNLVMGNHVINPGRMGIEDIGNIYRTQIVNNVCIGPATATAEGYGISAAGWESLVQGNTVRDFPIYGIEASGRGLQVVGNRCRQLQGDTLLQGVGIVINTGSGDPLGGSAVIGNYVEGFEYGIAATADHGAVQILGNNVVNCQRSIFGDTTDDYSILVIEGNGIRFTVPNDDASNAYRYGIYVTSGDGTGNVGCRILGNTVTWESTAAAGYSTSQEIAIDVNTVSATVAFNTVDAHGITGSGSFAPFGIYGAGSTVAGLRVIGNTFLGGSLVYISSYTTPVYLLNSKAPDDGTARETFFNASPAAKPTGVAVTAGGIHAALVTLGLISA